MARAKKSTKKRTTAKKAVRKTTKKTIAKKAAKKVVRKTAAKKTVRRVAKKASSKTARKSATKSKVQVYNLSQPAPENKYFVLANGKPVQHVAELAEILDDIEDHVFNHHVNPERNDFHNWVKDVFEDVQLAKKMLGVSDKKHLQLVIYKHAAKKALKKR